MRQCPTCNRSYGDETLTYCLADGSLLSDQYDSGATQRIPLPRETNKQTELLHLTPPTAQSTRRDTPLITYVVIGLLALIAGGTIVALIKWNSNGTSVVKTEGSVNAPSPAAKQDDLEEEKARLEKEKEQLALEKERQRLAEERKKLEEQKRESTSPNTRPVSPPSGTWFVFFGAFTKDEFSKAEERLQYVRRAGYDASIIDTDNYPNLRGGLWAVVSGPYSKSYAENLAAQAKSVRSDAYIKSGW